LLAVVFALEKDIF